jgi:hypothetical protein
MHFNSYNFEDIILILNSLKDSFIYLFNDSLKSFKELWQDKLFYFQHILNL